jgi:hypothetical protein
MVLYMRAMNAATKVFGWEPPFQTIPSQLFSNPAGKTRYLLSMDNIVLSVVYSNLLQPIEFIFACDCNVIKLWERAKRVSFDEALID